MSELTSKIRETYRRIWAYGNRNVWIHLIPEEKTLAFAAALRENLPLYGQTFAIKDNIDLAGVPTTAACPDFAYTPARSAYVVERLMAAGAIPIGKTNMDQFATGLVGTRSPYGACSSIFDERYISGGSSSGSAVAVAAGLVDFALGTDTAGSGRVPASFNNIAGLKPTRGALSTAGVVPACRSLDCVSIFAETCASARAVFQAARGFDASDSFSRRPGQTKAWPARGFRFGVPSADLLRFFGDESAHDLYESAIARFQNEGGVRVEFDFQPFLNAATLLYGGPWVAERLAAVHKFAKSHPDSLDPVVGRIILNGATHTAADAFEASYRLAALARAAEAQWGRMDFMLLPTAGSAYTHEEIATDPVGRNTNLGYYTNFVNLLDLAAISIPAGFRSNGIPFGVTLIGPPWSDDALISTAAGSYDYCPTGYVPLAVCGAHLSGQPLNWQLTEAGGFLIESCRTSPDYKFYALRGTVPPKPGLVRTPGEGAPIEVEVWAVPEARFGHFVAQVPPPLAIGTCTLEGGREVKSFLCERFALRDAEDITQEGGWREFLRSRV
ncbi:MAG TPA: allophanate hydrolase [Bryobacteraceae bacterium]|nr:allophanate hydrolase [Bryobacteraceae bacterium]